MEAYTTFDYSCGPWICADNFGDYGGPIHDRQMESLDPNLPMNHAEASFDDKNHGNQDAAMETDCNVAEIQEQS